MNPNDEAEEKRLNEILELHVSQLVEHFDNVQILVSTVTEGGDYTQSLARGAGNWHARIGQARELVMRDDETTRVSVAMAMEEGDEE